jgi:peroxisomal 2,4-dienoyl-CoA reductase
VRSSTACEGWVAALGAAWGPGLDVLINCAAGNFLATSEELSVNGFKTGAWRAGGVCGVPGLVAGWHR